MDDTFDKMLGELIEASTTASDFLTRLASRPLERRIELRSVTERLDKEFYPALPGRVFSVLALLPGKAWAVYPYNAVYY
jgi:hypothetical protein